MMGAGWAGTGVARGRADIRRGEAVDALRVDAVRVIKGEGSGIVVTDGGRELLLKEREEVVIGKSRKGVWLLSVDVPEGVHV